MASPKPAHGAHVHGPDCDHGPKTETVRRELPKVGRNDLCPCGSGKKYKKCHAGATQ